MTKLGTQSLAVRSDGSLSEYGPARSTITGAHMAAAIAHCTKGAGIWDWASNDHDRMPCFRVTGSSVREALLRWCRTRCDPPIGSAAEEDLRDE